MARGAQKSLVKALIGGAVIWAVPALLISVFILILTYRATIYRGFDEPLNSAVTSLIASADIDEQGSVSLARIPLDPRYQRALSGRYWIIGQSDGSGLVKVLLASRSYTEDTARLPLSAFEALAQNAGEPVRAIIAGPDENETLRIIARQVLLPTMRDDVIILAGADIKPVVRSIRRFALIALMLIVVFTTGLIFAVYTQVRVGLKPLFMLRNKVVDIREGRLSKIDGDYPAEITPLAQELNALIGHNKRIVDHAQTHVGNLAHALKTPIAVLQNEAQMADTMPSNIVQRQIIEMSAQVDHHLRRARAAARGQEIGVITDLDDVLQGLMRTLPRIYTGKALSFNHDGEKDLQFRGARRDLEEMIGNLLDNAAKWSAANVQIRSDISNEDAQLIITIEDDGPGMSQDDYETALKRGARLDEATPGSGLGLAIVNELAEAYKGSLALGRSDLGGLKVTLILPRVK